MKKKISQIILYLVLGVVVLGLVLCAVIKVNFKPEIQVPMTDAIGQIEITTTDGTSKVESSKENIDVKKFNNLFNSSFELSVLYSLFSGKLGSEMEVTKLTKEPTVSGYKVQFLYTEDVNLVINGKEQTIANNSTTPIKYNRVVFGVEAEKGLTNVALYFYQQGTTNTYYKVSTIANYNSLYNFISDLSMFGE